MAIDIPILRFGHAYESLDHTEVSDFRSGEVVSRIGLANAGIIRRDLQRMEDAAAAFRSFSSAELVERCAQAGEIFCREALPLGPEGQAQSPQQFIEALSQTTGLPHTLCQQNMEKIRTALCSMEAVLRGLTRGLDLNVIDRGIGSQVGPLGVLPVEVSVVAQTRALGVVLPSNSPGVNSIWLPSIPLKIPVVLKPGRQDPWTPLRIIQALVAAGCPSEGFFFYPTDHEGTDAILQSCDRSVLFGDDRTIARYAGDQRIQVHGTGRSKVIIGEDEVDRWQEHIEVLVTSVLENGGRSCINTSCILTPRLGDAIAEALAQRLATVRPTAPDDEGARLAAFADPRFAEAIDSSINAAIKTPGAIDLTARHRGTTRIVQFDGATFLLPTVVRCDSFEHPLANTEYLFPFVSVVEVPQDRVLELIGPTLVVSALTRDEQFCDRLLRCPLIDRLNLGPVPTCRVQWDQPHEGNLFEVLYHRRAVQRGGWGSTPPTRPGARSTSRARQEPAFD